MHQVLSYETAMRANSARDIREYVTKRTCVSLVLTMAFFTLISGYLLGKFVSDRQHHMRHLQDITLAAAEHGSLKQIRAYNNAKKELLTSARILSQSRGAINSQSSLNTEIFNKYISCTQDAPPSTNVSANEFIEQLLDKTTSKQHECITSIQTVIKNNLGPG
ncbi:uncharacterized protein LOC129913714 [Episyrphus balteatus]|uniref:uncharacterized protein LOC129913714 n=1 Tax=Episyrphus balteatus TaxID=286459 RepID=UPI0024853942|nr:uncharacterized protein LOC129913714 [Episyrphus balteatus]